MTILTALVLGIVQGLTEFLPVSSSGHLLLLEHIFKIEGGSLFFNVLVHFATLTAVVLVFWKDVCYLITHPLSKETKVLIVSTLPTIVFALVVEKFVNSYAMVSFLGFGFLISAIVILITSILQKKKAPKYYDVGYKQGLVIGLVQGIAVFPGISRSGSTICSALMQGIERERSASFSFLLSLPIIFGGMLFESVDGIKNGFGEVNVWCCLVGFVSALVTAILCIRLMKKLVQKGNWWPFAIYLFALSIIVILNEFVFAWF